MNPSNGLVLACALLAERWGGSMAESDRIAQRAACLAPNDANQRFALGGLATTAAWRGDYESALALGRKALTFGPGFVGGHLSIIESLIGLGRRDDAERHLARYMAMSPGVTIRSFNNGQHHADRSRLSRRIESLRLAGMPER
jgi:hypothetical protein